MASPLTTPATKSALQIISSADLSPTEHLLLNHFIEGAVDPDLAAQYLISRIDFQHDPEFCLRRFKQDWKKLAARLTTCDPVPKRLDTLVRRRDHPSYSWPRNQLFERGPVLAAEPAYIVPPSLLQNLGSAEEGRLLEILQAFLSPDHVFELQTLVASHNGDLQASLPNLWLLSPSMHRAFRAGLLEVRSMAQVREQIGLKPGSEPDETKHYTRYSMAKMHPEGPTDLLWGDGSEFESSLCHFKVWTPDPDTLSLPSTFLFKIHYRFATALHLFHVEDVAALGWPPQSRKGPIDFRAQHVGRIFLFLWLFIPFWIRIQCYFLLIRIGRSLYGRGPRHWVYPLPFGLVAKECINSGPNEPNALRLVDKYTSVPAPRLIDAGEYHGKTYLVMTRVPGQELSKVFHLMSYPERDRLVEDLKSCVAQLRKIPNHTPYLICDTLGGPVVDHRVPDKSGGPFNTEADFTKYLCLGCSPAEALGDVPVPQGHRSYFTHSDFDYSNLLIENGRLSGIVDWECAGYKPEYWEFTKALYTFDGGARGALFRRVFDNKYEQELAAERISRRFAPFGCL